jgi:hypothetical protein
MGEVRKVEKGTGELFSIEKTGFSIFVHASYTLALYFLAEPGDGLYSEKYRVENRHHEQCKDGGKSQTEHNGYGH